MENAPAKSAGGTGCWFGFYPSSTTLAIQTGPEAQGDMHKEPRPLSVLTEQQSIYLTKRTLCPISTQAEKEPIFSTKRCKQNCNICFLTFCYRMLLFLFQVNLIHKITDILNKRVLPSLKLSKPLSLPI